MSKAKYGYGWVLKWVLAALLLGVGFFMFFSPDFVYTITGVTILIFSVFRIYPLLKSLHKEVLRTINLVEIIFDTLIGILLVYIGITKGSTLTDEPIWSTVYQYSLAFFFYARGLVFFNSIAFFEEKTEVPKFWAHIVILSMGAIIAVLPDFGYESVALFFLIISLVGAAYLGYDGFGGYSKYREYSASINAGKQVGKDKEADKGINIDKEAPKKRIEDPEEKRPYVN
ncbi:hypothetical protein [Peloplasma aerotolerans]|jgi:hypothetical protein|uniref:DUF308 domain-containing protein n=1 Tax=Peloplasma aerotolerans TaxID=3044389 RepID=A0AAW6U9A0_9MOLU|nr:hypothetical protein [Mariniplasma sp. M4Ah]MDI6453475.1 hypothetical protein [Mariniplasma sp. M4Ah]